MSNQNDESGKENSAEEQYWKSQFFEPMTEWPASMTLPVKLGPKCYICGIAVKTPYMADLTKQWCTDCDTWHPLTQNPLPPPPDGMVLKLSPRRGCWKCRVQEELSESLDRILDRWCPPEERAGEFVSNLIKALEESDNESHSE